MVLEGLLDLAVDFGEQGDLVDVVGEEGLEGGCGGLFPIEEASIGGEILGCGAEGLGEVFEFGEGAEVEVGGG